MNNSTHPETTKHRETIFSLFLLMTIVSVMSIWGHQRHEKLSTPHVDNFNDVLFIEVQGPALTPGVYKFFSNLLTLNQLCVTFYPLSQCEQWVREKGDLVLTSGDAVRFLRGGSVEIAKMAGAKRLAFGILLDPNADGFEDLIAVPGIGEKTAQKIIKRRKEKGQFTSLDELQRFVGRRVDVFKYFKVEQ